MNESGSEKSTLEVIEATKRDVLAGGMTSISSGGRSVGFISLETLAKLEQEERLKQVEGIYAKTIQSTPYDPRW